MKTKYSWCADIWWNGFAEWAVPLHLETTGNGGVFITVLCFTLCVERVKKCL